MTRTFTQEDVIKYCYNELEPPLVEAFETALHYDHWLQSVYEETRALQAYLNQGFRSPSKTTEMKITTHAKLFSLQVS